MATTATYIERVNLAIDQVVNHLHEPQRLRDLSRVAMLSPFHFHRVFQALVGATPADFVKRLRLEKALGLMARSRAPSLTSIALACGISSSSDFSRCFKQGDAVVRAVRRLIAWAERQGLANEQWLGYQWDNPEITPLEDCRYHVAVEAERFTPKSEVGRFKFPPMVVAEIEIRGGIDLELRALQWLYGTWLPRSGYVPDDHPCFEAWIGRPFAHGTEYFELRVQLPIRQS